MGRGPRLLLANPPFLGAHMGGVLGTLEAFFCEKSAAIHPGQRDPPSVAPGQRDPPSVALVVVPAAAGREDDEAPHCAPLLASKYARGSMVLRRLDHAFRAGLAHKHTRRPDQVHDPPTTSPTVASSLRPTLPSPPTSQPPLPTPRPADPPDSPRYPPTARALTPRHGSACALEGSAGAGINGSVAERCAQSICRRARLAAAFVRGVSRAVKKGGGWQEEISVFT